jgi:hypothetical protein
VFLTGTSALPSVITGGAVGTFTGLDYGIAANVSPTDSMLIADPVRPWNSQLYQATTNSATGNIYPNPDFYWPQTTGVTSIGDYGTRVLQATMGSSSDALGLIAGDGGVYSMSSIGVWGYRKADFVVCDQGRLSRWDASGNPIWTADATLNAGPATAVGAAMNVKPLVRATKAYPIPGSTDLLVVDTGASRIIRIDQSGLEERSISAFVVDPLNTVSGYQPNETRDLKGPRDALVYTSIEYPTSFSAPNQVSNPQSVEYWVHYVIADTGNKRIVELIDRYYYDPTTGGVGSIIDYTDPNSLTPGNLVSAMGVLWTHSPAAFDGKSFAYNSVARDWVVDSSGGRYVVVAGAGGDLPTATDTGLDTPTVGSAREERSGNGGVIVFDGANSQVINTITIPAVAANTFWNWTDSAFDAPAQAAETLALSGVKSVTMRNVQLDVDGSGTLVSMPAIMVADSDGVFEIVENNGTWQVDWMMPRLAYQVMRQSNGVPTTANPVDFRPTYARRLPSGAVLLVNAYTGFNRAGNVFQGEVLEVDGTIPSGIFSSGFQYTSENLGFNSASIHVSLPTTQGARGIIQPVFADRR